MNLRDQCEMHMQVRIAQKAQKTLTAFVFMIEQSTFMKKKTMLWGERISLSEAVTRIVDRQISELMLRCVNGLATRHYYDIAVFGYGHDVYSVWNDKVEGWEFATPMAFRNNAYEKNLRKEKVLTRNGIKWGKVRGLQWVKLEHRDRLTFAGRAFEKATLLLEQWIKVHQGKLRYPPVVINITCGNANDILKEDIQMQANKLKSLFTEKGNVFLFNIHITPDEKDCILFPTDKSEVEHDSSSSALFELSSPLPERYNKAVVELRGDITPDMTPVAMAFNVNMPMLDRLINIIISIDLD